MEGGQKVHDLVIREPAAGRGSGKRRRRDNEVEMGEGDAAEEQAEGTPPPVSFGRSCKTHGGACASRA